jgi:hypothetical protein
MVGKLLRGLAAGVAGTAAMTALQLAVAKAQGKPLATPVPARWEEAPAPARVAKRGAEAVGRGGIFTREDVPFLTNAMHWLYGTSWGLLYGAVRPPNGLVFGTGVWAASYAELVPLGIYEPPWRYPKKELALDWSYHAAYGVTLAAAFAVLDR